MNSDEFVVHIVDPDTAIADGLATLLSTWGIEVVSYPDAETFLRSWAYRLPQRGCLLIEADLPGVSGPALLERLNGDSGDLSVLLLVSTSPPGLLEAARSSSRVRVIEKPCVDDTLVKAILRIREAA